MDVREISVQDVLDNMYIGDVLFELGERSGYEVEELRQGAISIVWKRDDGREVNHYFLERELREVADWLRKQGINAVKVDEQHVMVYGWIDYV